jgi:hypothetical protein
MTPARLLLASILFVGAAPAVFGHDIWINQQKMRNGAGEWCCGEEDCAVIPPDQITMGRDFYIIAGAEKVPFAEAQPSPDGAFWRCKRPDGTRRCFFAPPPGS